MPKENLYFVRKPEPEQEGGFLRQTDKYKIGQTKKLKAVVEKAVKRRAEHFEFPLSLNPLVDMAKKAIIDKTFVGKQNKEREDKERSQGIEKVKHDAMLIEAAKELRDQKDKQIKHTQLMAKQAELADLLQSTVDELENLNAISSGKASTSTYLMKKAMTQAMKQAAILSSARSISPTLPAAISSTGTPFASIPGSPRATTPPPPPTPPMTKAQIKHAEFEKEINDILSSETDHSLQNIGTIYKTKNRLSVLSAKKLKQIQGITAVFKSNPVGSGLEMPIDRSETSASDKPQRGSGFFSKLKDFAKSIGNSIIDRIKKDPIESIAKGIEFGQAIRKRYTDAFPKKIEEDPEKAGSFRIPKRHAAIIKKHLKEHLKDYLKPKDIKGGGWFSSLMSGFLTPFSILKKVGDVIPIPGVSDAIKAVGSIGDKIGDLTGTQALI